MFIILNKKVPLRVSLKGEIQPIRAGFALGTKPNHFDPTI